jgi:hypothetical protein
MTLKKSLSFNQQRAHDKLQNFHQRGQSILEYIILTTFIGLFCLAAIKKLGGVIDKRIDRIQADIVSSMPAS